MFTTVFGFNNNSINLIMEEKFRSRFESSTKWAIMKFISRFIWLSKMSFKIDPTFIKFDQIGLIGEYFSAWDIGNYMNVFTVDN